MPFNTERQINYDKARRALFDQYYSFLNKEQRESVYTVNGPLLVLAGAGTGKTTVLVNRIAHMIKFGDAYYNGKDASFVSDDDIAELESSFFAPKEEIERVLLKHANKKVPAFCILAITFTNKAAGEIKERLERTVGEENNAADIWAGTFHSVCVRILRRSGERIGLKRDFTIYDADDSKKLISSILKDFKIDEKILPAKTAQNTVSRFKERLLSPDDVAAQTGNADVRTRQLILVYREYQKRLAESGAVDFDDIICKTVELLQKDEESADFYSNKFRYICVDEYQDTNHSQFMLAKLLSAKHKNLMVVGDDDQSIYRFRGATIENILSFDRTYPNAKTIKLEQNYRSTSVILNAANAVIGNNKARKGKALWTKLEGGDKITLKELATQNDEARFIVNKINSCVLAGTHKYSDFAVLYRMNAQSNALEGAFAKSGISYRILGGTRFYDRKEIKDIIAYLCLINNNSDTLRLKRIINEPKRGIGNATIDAVESIARTEGISAFEVMKNSVKYTALSRVAPRLNDFCRFICTMAEEKENISVSSLIERVIVESGYRDMLIAAGEAESDRLENVAELVSNAVEYEKQAENPSLSGFLEDVALISDIDNYDENADSVVLMTIHSAKGLEFPSVFLPGMENGIFPSIMNQMSNEEMEEERRLAYVAITRAKKSLYITHCKERLLFGHTQYNPVSEFVREIPEQYLDNDGVQKKAPRSETPFSYAAQKPSFSSEKSVFTKKAPVATERFNIGDIVHHPNFGRGQIMSVKPMASDTMYEIAFEDFGTKKLMATYAKLKKE